MSPMLHDALPLATTAAFTPGRALVIAHAGQWQSALARAAAATEVPAAAANRPTEVERARTGAAQPERGTPPPDLPTKVITTSNASPRTAGASVTAPAIPPIPAWGAGASHLDPLPTTRSMKAPLIGHQAADPTVPPHPTRKTGPATGPHLAMRIHVEQHGPAGMTVWLGADGDATAVAMKAAAVLAELHRGLPLAGHRLARLVCNGVPVYIAPDFEKETS